MTQLENRQDLYMLHYHIIAGEIKAGDMSQPARLTFLTFLSSIFTLLDILLHIECQIH